MNAMGVWMIVCMLRKGQKINIAPGPLKVLCEGKPSASDKVSTYCSTLVPNLINIKGGFVWRMNFVSIYFSLICPKTILGQKRSVVNCYRSYES